MIGTYYKPMRKELAFSFTAKIKWGQCTTSDEADDIQWFNLNDLPDNTIIKQLERICDYQHYTWQTIMKIQ
jgi:hypothetical protein